ncbi:P-loop containing nucleoside triphosphate hydrolase protein [Leptodontidium sp. MPI-SDFR-AT-0119]|nr:P-loop containing nucleoside triphosphate hydrolase protein [Leptodontidium sp. MPI-SDFR-AT-0119]
MAPNAQTSKLRKRKSDAVDPEPEVAESSKTPEMKWKRTRGSIAAAAKEVEDLPTPPDSTVDAETPGPSIIPGKDADFGTSTSVKVFYEGKRSHGGHYDWVETPPKQLNEKIAKANNRVAIKIFKIKDHEQPTISGKTPLKIHSIEIQSAILVAALKDILKPQGMYLETSEPAKFQEPFKPLFFTYDKIIALYDRTKAKGLLKEHLNLLVQVMDEMFGSFMEHLKHLNASGLISYKLAWTYFPKHTMIFYGTKDCERVCRVTGTNYVSHPVPLMNVDCEEIAFDGECFDWTPIQVQIPMFGGNRPVTDLPCYPISFHDSPETVKERLTERAKKALEYQELTYCDYTGVGLLVTQCGVQRHNVTGRILIDYFGYKKHFEGLQRSDSNSRRKRHSQPAPPPSGSTDEPKYVQTLAKEKQEENKKEMLGKRKDELVYVSPLLEGFALKNKQWLNFYVDDLKPVVWNDEAYGHLVYPEEQKDLVLTFVDNHQRMKARVDDVIMGKGQGLILLLSGPPGTGKTLTAEAVADKTRRPLYYLQAEDLGTDASRLGPKIKKVFEMATEWDAVILLDEADVFMAERDPGDIARNELVSIFLRELEYFKGIIFLTTNLYSTIDVAFRSRVNIHLVFNSLPFSSRLVLWRKFLSRLPGEDVESKLQEGDMEELAKWELNGREIKNAIKTVRTWCLCKGFEISLLRLEAGIKVTAPQAGKNEDMSL